MKPSDLMRTVQRCCAGVVIEVMDGGTLRPGEALDELAAEFGEQAVLNALVMWFQTWQWLAESYSSNPEPDPALWLVKVAEEHILSAEAEFSEELRITLYSVVLALSEPGADRRAAHSHLVGGVLRRGRAGWHEYGLLLTSMVLRAMEDVPDDR